jgi:hypothetical protein
MSFYVFRLDEINFNSQRGSVPDNDVVTFGVFVNQVDRGSGAGLFTDLVSGAKVPSRAVGPDIRRGMSATWTVGPLEINSADGVIIAYTGMNVSDSPEINNANQQGAIELKILDSAVSAAIGAAGLGLIGSAITGALGLVGAPLEKLLGFSSQGPCNGLVFSDGVIFTGGGLEELPAAPRFEFLNATQSGAFTRSYTDQATHDSNNCNKNIAETDVEFSVFRLPFVSIKDLALFIWGADTRFPFPGLSLRGLAIQGLGAAPNVNFSLRSNIAALASLPVGRALFPSPSH